MTEGLEASEPAVGRASRVVPAPAEARAGVGAPFAAPPPRAGLPGASARAGVSHPWAVASHLAIDLWAHGREHRALA